MSPIRYALPPDELPVAPAPVALEDGDLLSEHGKLLFKSRNFFANVLNVCRSRAPRDEQRQNRDDHYADQHLRLLPMDRLVASMAICGRQRVSSTAQCSCQVGTVILEAVAVPATGHTGRVVHAVE